MDPHEEAEARREVKASDNRRRWSGMQVGCERLACLELNGARRWSGYDPAAEEVPRWHAVARHNGRDSPCAAAIGLGELRKR